MCGIAGEIRFAAGPSEADWQHIADLMERRGPDDAGFWDDGQHCTLAFRRLAILDLSPRGHQPMVDDSGRYALVFNGEIYNFRELRADLESGGDRFRSSGDAEVLLKALIRWGSDAIPRLNGIFAFGFYDRHEGSMLLARDHAGIKPLYWLRDRRGVVFGSQFDQILAHPWSRDHALSDEGLRLYLRYSYVPAPFTVLDGCSMLEPGTWVEIGLNGAERTRRYWQFPQHAEPSLRGQQAVDAVDEALTSAVERQLVSDVPVGAFLSGGIDSPLVIAKMTVAGREPVRAYTIATGEPATDESRDAAGYAAELGVEHVIERITPDDMLELLPDTVSASSEPFGDYSIFPTMLVSRFASADFKVMLSGDGGDELFWGYPQRSADVIRHAPAFRIPYALRRLRSVVREAIGRPPAAQLRVRSVGDWYRTRHTCLKQGWLSRVFPDIERDRDEFDGYRFHGSGRGEVAGWLRRNEFLYHLTMVLLKVDRASMHCSQEVRVPLLDREFVETAAAVDWQSCLDLESGVGKIPLRQALAKHVRHQSRDKRGFESPMAEWLRGSLRERFEDMVLARDELLGQPIDQAALRSLYDRHLSGDENHARGLWPLLSLALWEEHHLARSPKRPYRPLTEAPATEITPA